jgi:hypothetical protein
LLRKPPRIMRPSESAKPRNARNFSRDFNESEYITQRHMTTDLKGLLRRPCPLILRGVCIIHPVRPLACRGHASFDRTACARAAAGRNVEVPISEPHLDLRGLVQNALQSALRAAGVAASASIFSAASKSQERVSGFSTSIWPSKAAVPCIRISMGCSSVMRGS